MKRKSILMRALALAVGVLGASASADAQTNIGASCGCLPLASRPEVLLTSTPGYVAISGTFGGELTTGANLTCDKTYILDKKIYIPAGQTITIAPGTVIKGATSTAASDATALIIERGGKIIANGLESCPIVFTAQADPMDGTYPVSNISKWGGLVILGKATNNLTLAANGPYTPGASGKLAVADGLGVIEGFASSNPQDRFGVMLSGSVPGETVGTFDDNDNSGILRYVSVRHSGAILVVGNELNGITLGSVGRGTTMEHIEVVSSGDDNIEWFGGTVNSKYITSLFGNDDMYDWDDGYTGKMQFVFGMKADAASGVSPDNDNGFEGDADDQKSNLLPRSHPIIYNTTLVGNSKSTGTVDNSGLAAIMAKELTEGEIYNSIFANFREGLNLVKSLGTGRTFAAGGESWHNWTNIPGPASASAGNGSQSLKVVCNTFVGCANPLTIGASSASPGTVQASGSVDYTQFTVTDKNDVIAGNTLPGFDYSFAISPASNNSVTTKNDVIPNPALSITGCPTPTDNFFETAQFRGAFSSTPGQNWLSNWTYSQVLNSTKGVRACTTDLNLDGVTDVNDFLIFAPAFGTTCN